MILVLIAKSAGSFYMSCCEPWIVDDKEAVGVCPQCEGDINKDGITVDAGCVYSPVECETCGFQPCDLSC